MPTTRDNPAEPESDGAPTPTPTAPQEGFPHSTGEQRHNAAYENITTESSESSETAKSSGLFEGYPLGDAA